MNFLDYIGQYYNYEEKEDKYTFVFKNNRKKSSKYYSIVPPVYDGGFKKIFFYGDEGIKIVRDFLNALIYPKKKSIISLKYLPKEILNNSNLKYNKGSLIVDNAYLATIEYEDKSGKKYEKNVILDIEMQINNFGEAFNERCFDYGTGLRNHHDYKETWVIALCFDNSKELKYDKGANSYFIKELNLDKTQQRKNYVNIYKIFLNKLYNDPQPRSINGEEIGIIGREWIKLFCISLWCKSHNDDKINYYIPSEISFIGKEIKNAIEILSCIDIFERKRARLLLIEEEKTLREIYDDGFAKGKEEGKNEGIVEGMQLGFNQGFDEGMQLGFNQGFDKGMQLGYDNCLIQILDKFFINFKSKQSMDNIEMLGIINYSFLIGRYGQDPDINPFLHFLLNKNMLNFD